MAPKPYLKIILEPFFVSVRLWGRLGLLGELGLLEVGFLIPERLGLLEVGFAKKRLFGSKNLDSD